MGTETDPALTAFLIIFILVGISSGSLCGGERQGRNQDSSKGGGGIRLRGVTGTPGPPLATPLRGVPLYPSLKLMFTLPDSFCAATKTIPGR